MNPEISKLYLQLGFEHILPLGFDHILFIVSLFLLSGNLKSILWQATIFTIAHCVTLGLTAAGILDIPSQIVEPLIALSIVYVALENIFLKKLKPSRLVVIFLFGLMHGCGFAGVLRSLGMPQDEFVNALLCFNIGVELGQICIIVICWLLLGSWAAKQEWYRKFIVVPLSALIALTGLYWTIERIFF